jgi:uncharacterized protein YceK
MRGFMVFLLVFTAFCTIALSGCGGSGSADESPSTASSNNANCVWDSANSTWNNCNWGQ